MGRSSTLSRLALETAQSHAWIDEAMLGPLDFPTTTGYRRFLCMLYGFQAPLEAALAATPGMDFEFLAPRCKTSRIAGDLLSLGLTRHEHHLLARRQSIGPFENVAQAYGFMYATERLMLPVEALRVRLENEMPVVTGLASQFLYAYSNTAELRWRQFGSVLDRAARTFDVEQIVASAKLGIESLQGWLTQHVPATQAPKVAERIRASA
jgi:heme oxygenase